MATEDKSKAAELFDQAMKNYEQALRMGLKLQEESAKLWTGLMGQGPTPADWQKRVKTVSDELIPQSQKAMDECLKLIEQSGKSSLDLLKRAVSASQATTPTEWQTRWLGLWEGSLSALRDQAVAVAQANSRATETWLGMARKSWESTVSAKP